MQNSSGSKLGCIAVLGFCALMLLDWTGVTGRGFPSNWGEALIQVCVNIAWTIFFTVLSYFVMLRNPRQTTTTEDGDRPSKVSD